MGRLTQQYLHSPLYLEKYAFLYLTPSWSFQKCVGIHGNGLVHTSSALSPYTGLPNQKMTGIRLLWQIVSVFNRTREMGYLLRVNKTCSAVKTKLVSRKHQFCIIVSDSRLYSASTGCTESQALTWQQRKAWKQVIISPFLVIIGSSGGMRSAITLKI